MPTPDDWSTLNRATRREALGALRAQVQRAPADTAARAEVVRAYRQLRHVDQAGRWAIGLPEGATAEELREYGRLLRRIGASEDKARRLSVLPRDTELPDALLKALHEPSPTEGWRWWWLVLVAWAVSCLVFAVSLVLVYLFAYFGSEDVQMIARWSAQVGGTTVVAALALTTLWCGALSKGRPAAILGTITLVGAVVNALGWIRLLS